MLKEVLSLQSYVFQEALCCEIWEEYLKDNISLNAEIKIVIVYVSLKIELTVLNCKKCAKNNAMKSLKSFFLR